MNASYNNPTWGIATVYYMFHRGLVDMMEEWSEIAKHERHTHSPEFNAWYEDFGTRLSEWAKGINVDRIPDPEKPVVGAHVAMAGSMLYASAMTSLRHIDEITGVWAAFPETKSIQTSVGMEPLYDMIHEAVGHIDTEDAVLYESEADYAHSIAQRLEERGEEVCGHLREGLMREPNPDLMHLLAQALAEAEAEMDVDIPAPSNGHYQA